MKRIITLLLALCMVVMLVGCKKKGKPEAEPAACADAHAE